MAHPGYEDEARDDERCDDETSPGFPAVYIDDASCDLIWASGMWVTDAAGFTAALHRIPDLGRGPHPGVAARSNWPGE